MLPRSVRRHGGHAGLNGMVDQGLNARGGLEHAELAVDVQVREGHVGDGGRRQERLAGGLPEAGAFTGLDGGRIRLLGLGKVGRLQLGGAHTGPRFLWESPLAGSRRAGPKQKSTWPWRLRHTRHRGHRRSLYQRASGGAR